MAGQKLTNQTLDALEAAGGEELVFSMLADGNTLISVVRELQRMGDEYPGLERMGRGTLSTWCNRPERKERYLEARRMGAISFAEESVEILDNATVADAFLRDKQAQSKRWFAGKLDEGWDKRDQAQVNVNINQLHLDAVRQLGREERPALEDDRVVEGEVIESPGEGVEDGDDWLS